MILNKKGHHELTTGVYPLIFSLLITVFGIIKLSLKLIFRR